MLGSQTTTLNNEDDKELFLFRNEYLCAHYTNSNPEVYNNLLLVVIKGTHRKKIMLNGLEKLQDRAEM